jgi:hypothetical protein
MVRLCVAIFVLLMPAWPALSQQAPLAPSDQPSAPPPLPPAEAAPPKKDGFFDALEKWWDKSAADFKAGVDKSQDDWRKLNERNEKAAKDAAAAAKEAAEALSKLSSTRIVEGRETCTVAPNGSPDCNAAAEKICKAKGFAIGTSADIQTNKKCSVRAWLSRDSSESACTMETIVTKAACQ